MEEEGRREGGEEEGRWGGGAVECLLETSTALLVEGVSEEVDKLASSGSCTASVGAEEVDCLLVCERERETCLAA